MQLHNPKTFTALREFARERFRLALEPAYHPFIGQKGTLLLHPVEGQPPLQ